MRSETKMRNYLKLQIFITTQTVLKNDLVVWRNRNSKICTIHFFFNSHFSFKERTWFITLHELRIHNNHKIHQKELEKIFRKVRVKYWATRSSREAPPISKMCCVLGNLKIFSSMDCSIDHSIDLLRERGKIFESCVSPKSVFSWTHFISQFQSLPQTSPIQHMSDIVKFSISREYGWVSFFWKSLWSFSFGWFYCDWRRSCILFFIYFFTHISFHKVLLTATSTTLLNFWLASRVGRARRKYGVDVRFIFMRFVNV